MNKKMVRLKFRNECFKRDNYSCVMCNKKFDKNDPNLLQILNCHHITDRNEMPNGGYVKENGISLCEACHELAEEYHKKWQVLPWLFTRRLVPKNKVFLREGIECQQKTLTQEK